MREEEGRKGEERCLFPIARIPLWLLQTCQYPHHSSRGLPLRSLCETLLPMSHFISGLCCTDSGSAALLVFWRHLLPFLFGKPVTFCRRSHFQSSVPSPDPSFCYLRPKGYLNIYAPCCRGLCSIWSFDRLFAALRVLVSQKPSCSDDSHFMASNLVKELGGILNVFINPHHF